MVSSAFIKLLFFLNVHLMKLNGGDPDNLILLYTVWLCPHKSAPGINGVMNRTTKTKQNTSKNPTQLLSFPISQTQTRLVYERK